MANSYNFTDDDLLLDASRSAQLTSALANTGVADPLQFLCDEAAAEVARMTTGYVLDDPSVFSFIRACALYKAYSYSGTPVPPDVDGAYKDARAELEAIAGGKRPNLPKVSNTAQKNSIAGGFGGSANIPGRIDPDSIPQ